MKKFILTTLMLMTVIMTAQTAVPPSSGDGSSGNPYQIGTLENLYWIAAKDSIVSTPTATARWNSAYIQTADINASATSSWFDGKGWSPIGDTDNAFKGTYNGQGYSISDLYINRPTEEYLGLFTQLYDASVSNLTLSNVNFYGGDAIGALASVIGIQSMVTNCHSSGTVTGNPSSNGWLVGGLAGRSVVAEISNSSSSCTVSGTQYSGVLIGDNAGTEIIRCFTTGSATGTDYVGGIAGKNSGVIRNSYSSASTTGTSTCAGGMCGWNDGEIYTSYSRGAVSAPSQVGGFVGLSTEGEYICYWDTQASGQTTSDGGAYGRTTAEMKIIDTYLLYGGWDFNTIWNIDGVENSGYPYLKWQFPTAPSVSTQAVSDIYSATATGNATIEDTGYPAPSQHGVCWNTAGSPTVEDSKTEQGSISAAGTYTSQITGLSPNTIYYVRAYASNSIGTAYGEEVNFTTLPGELPDGTGDENDPYLISTAGNLYWLQNTPTEWSGNHFIQTNDIDMSESASWNEGLGCETIGNTSMSFASIYDGQGYVIYGLTIQRSSTEYIGMFGTTYSATIKNLGLESVNVRGGNFTGAIAGTNQYSTIDNCYVTGSINGKQYCGGIAGYNYVSVISNSRNSASVTATLSQVGGITGNNYNSSTVVNCCNTATITGGINSSIGVGGIAGANNTSTVRNSYNSGYVTGKQYCGGIVGQNVNTSYLKDSYSFGNVKAGYTISYCGGAVGSNSSSYVQNTYSKGTVTGGSFYVGGLIGYDTAGSVTNSFWDTQTSGQTSSAGGTGKTTSEMTDQSTYLTAGWDFRYETNNGTSDFWVIDSVNNGGYPWLEWQNYPPQPPTNISITTSATESSFSWDSVPGATSYYVYSTIDPSASFPDEWTLETEVTDPNWIDNNVSENDHKFYLIVAVN